MPNHVENHWSISIDEERKQEVLDLMTEDGKVTFKKIIPMPEILGRVISDGQVDGFRIMEPTDEDPYGRRPATEEEVAEIRATGYPDWYEWSCDNWGTKWDAYGDQEVNENKYRINLHFDTAWGPPIPVAEALIERFRTDEDDYDQWITLEGFYGGEVDEPGAFRLSG